MADYNEEQWRDFWYCINAMCNLPVHPELKNNYQNDITYILELQDHVINTCELCTKWDFHALCVIEMAETYVNYKG